MRIFIAGISTETNTYSPIPTGAVAFRVGSPEIRDTTRRPPEGGGIPMHTWRKAAERDGHEVVESIYTSAQPAGRTIKAVYEELRDTVIADLKAAMPVQAVALALHGAMVAEGYDDCEGDLIAHVREVVGPDVFIGVELDLHCHLTALRVAKADVIVTYKEYPHIDMRERAEEIYDLLVRTVAGEIRPVMVAKDCRMIGVWHPTKQPMRGFVDRMSALEGRDGILSVSFGHGFAWADVPEVGARMLVIADGDKAKAAALADRLAQEIWELREQTMPPFQTLEGTLDSALAIDGGPVVIADTADNAGGGAPSDSTFFLREMLARGIAPAAIGPFWDPVAVSLCREAGAGAKLKLRLGGKLGPVSGDPVDLDAEVLAVADDYQQTGLSGGIRKLGPSVRIRAGGIEMIVTTQRCQAFHPDLFTGLGTELSAMKIIVVKSSQHFHAGFAPIAKDVLYAASPGTLNRDFASMEMPSRKEKWWPRDANPFA